ncbi:hypothetical protein, partial [Saccharopolyspora sp. NPDC002376]
DAVPEMTRKAFKTAQSERPGAVFLAVPEDIEAQQSMQVSWSIHSDSGGNRCTCHASTSTPQNDATGPCCSARFAATPNACRPTPTGRQNQSTPAASSIPSSSVSVTKLDLFCLKDKPVAHFE